MICVADGSDPRFAIPLRFARAGRKKLGRLLDVTTQGTAGRREKMLDVDDLSRQHFVCCNTADLTVKWRRELGSSADAILCLLLLSRDKRNIVLRANQV